MAHAADRGLIAGASEVPDSFWGSLRYFNLYRLAVAAVFLVTGALYGDGLALGGHSPRLFHLVSAAYLVAALAFQAIQHRYRGGFKAQLSAQLAVDVVALTLLMYASGGFRSGIAIMLLISLAAAGLVSRGTPVLAYAALATIAVLLEQAAWVVFHDQPVGNFVQPALISIGFFATAIITSRLAQRVITNERVARQRGLELANQLRVNQLVIREVQDGVLIVDANGLVRSHNPAVEGLLGRTPPELDQVEAYSLPLREALDAWREGRAPDAATFTMPDSGKLVRARFVAAGVEGDRFTVVYLEDISKLEDQARQVKLAALGRLTANIAHEIRNPLAAITHAVELLTEENRGPARERLTRIIRDNARRLDRMVKDVLELNRRDRVQSEPIRLGAFLAIFLEEFAASEKVPPDGLALDLATDATVDFDRVHLNQVLWNLARNAWRHSRQQAGSVRVRVQRAGNRLELHVLDDGAGVKPDLRPQLFEPFFTTFSAGTGLGLYIARELAAANGAVLEYVESAAGGDFRIAWQGIRS